MHYFVTNPAVYELKGECEEAKKFDACIKEASVKVGLKDKRTFWLRCSFN